MKIRETEPTPAEPLEAPRPAAGLRRWLFRLLSATIIGIFLGYLYVSRQRFAQLLDLSPAAAMKLAAVILAMWVLRARREQILYAALDRPVPLPAVFAASTTAGLMNYLPLRVGTLAKAQLLKRLHGLRYARFLVAMAMHEVLFISALGLLGLAIFPLVMHQAPPRGLWLPVLYLGCAVGPLAALLLPVQRLSVRGTIGRVLADMGTGWSQLRSNRRALVGTVLLVGLTQLAAAFRLVVAFECLGENVNWASAMVLAISLQLGSYLALTPGPLGLREAVVGMTAGLIGCPIELGLFAASVDRIVALALTLLLGVPCTWWAWARTRPGT